MSLSETIITRSPDETHALGERIARDLAPGDLIAFYGDLGSGKTQLIKGICAGLQVQDWVNSPTFIIINEYRARLADGPLPVYHFDLYRLSGPDELVDLGAEEYLYGQGICLIEWAERAGDLLPPRRLEVRLDYLAPEERRIALHSLEE